MRRPSETGARRLGIRARFESTVHTIGGCLFQTTVRSAGVGPAISSKARHLEAIERRRSARAWLGQAGVEGAGVGATSNLADEDPNSPRRDAADWRRSGARPGVLDAGARAAMDACRVHRHGDGRGPCRPGCAGEHKDCAGLHPDQSPRPGGPARVDSDAGSDAPALASRGRADGRDAGGYFRRGLAAQMTRLTQTTRARVRRRVFDHAVRLPLHRVYELKSGGAASILRQDAGQAADLLFSLLVQPLAGDRAACGHDDHPRRDGLEAARRGGAAGAGGVVHAEDVDRADPPPAPRGAGDADDDRLRTRPRPSAGCAWSGASRGSGPRPRGSSATTT